MTEETAKSPTTLTRQELYEAVWETPMSRLATQYGISGNGLAKICDRLNVPYPPRGYWAKKAAGKRVVKLRLPVANGQTATKATINPTPPAQLATEPSAELQKSIEAAKTLASEAVVADRLTRPHPLIANWIADHARRQEEARNERDPWRKQFYDPGPVTHLEKRRQRILDALFKLLEKNGFKIKQGERQELFAETQKEKIEFQLREKYKQARRPLTAEESKSVWNKDRRWVQEKQVTGNLVFSFKTWLPGKLKQEWLETDSGSLEALLPDIAATFLTAAPLLVQQRKEREEEERQRQIVERKRYEEKQRRQREDNRWKRFVDFAHERQEVETAQSFLSSLKQMDHPDGTIDGKTIAEWIIWAEDNLSARDPMTRGTEHIFGTIAGITEWNYRD